MTAEITYHGGRSYTIGLLTFARGQTQLVNDEALILHLRGRAGFAVHVLPEPPPSGPAEAPQEPVAAPEPAPEPPGSPDPPGASQGAATWPQTPPPVPRGNRRRR